MSRTRAGWSGERIRRSHRWDTDVHAQISGAAEFARQGGMPDADISSQTDVVNQALDLWLGKFEKKHNQGQFFDPPEAARRGRPRGATHREYVTAQYMWDALILERLDGALAFNERTSVEPSLLTKDHIVNQAAREYCHRLARKYHEGEPFTPPLAPQRGRPPSSTRTRQRGTSPG